MQVYYTKYKYYIDLLLFLVLLSLDLVSKYVFYDQALYQSLYLVEPVMNMGISFSRSVSYNIVIPLSFIALCFFCYYYYKQSFPPMIMILLITWTLWNLYDRLVYGWVRDFIVMPWRFVYNIADVLLSMWVIWAVYILLKHK